MDNFEFLYRVLRDEKTDFFLFFKFAPIHYKYFAVDTFKFVFADVAQAGRGSCILYTVYGSSSNMNAICLCHKIQAETKKKTTGKRYLDL